MTKSIMFVLLVLGAVACAVPEDDLGDPEGFLPPVEQDDKENGLIEDSFMWKCNTRCMCDDNGYLEYPEPTYRTCQLNEDRAESDADRACENECLKRDEVFNRVEWTECNHEPDGDARCQTP